MKKSSTAPVCRLLSDLKSILFPAYSALNGSSVTQHNWLGPYLHCTLHGSESVFLNDTD